MGTNAPSTISEEIDIRIAKIYRRPDGIICVQTKKDVFIDIEDSRESFEAIKALANGDKVPVLSLPGSGAAISDEVRKDWIVKRKNSPVLAEAVVAKSLAHKIVVNFIVNFYDAGRPMKMFTEEEDAVKWLKQKSRQRYKLDQ